MMVSVKTRKTKLHRRHSDGALHIEELFPDDIGYDADIEIVRPNQYEDAESDTEDEPMLRRLWPDTDDELAAKLRRMSCDPHVFGSASQDAPGRGRKRRSLEMDADDQTGDPGTQLEVSELVDGDHRAEQPSAKRRKKRVGKQGLPPNPVTKENQPTDAWSDSTDKSDDGDGVLDSSNSGTPLLSSTTANTPAHSEVEATGGFDAMDIS